MFLESKTHTSKTHGSKQIKLYKYRSRKVRLAWCKAVLDIIKCFDVKKINDLGCNYFQLFKEIQARKIKYDYFGYDLDKNFVQIGLDYLIKSKLIKKIRSKGSVYNSSEKAAWIASTNKFKFNYKICNVENDNLRICDCSVLSAILEHSDFPNSVLKNVFKTTKKIIILRTFVDTTEQKAIQIKNVKKPYNIRRFSFKILKNIFLKNGFILNFILDEATMYSTKSLYVNNNKKNQRKFYICLGLRKQ